MMTRHLHRSTKVPPETEVTFCVQGVSAPLLANPYFRRFLLAWEQHGHRRRLYAHVVNYADDLVICCPPGNGMAALAAMRQLMARLGLTVNEEKTRLVSLPEEHFDFLGYTLERFYGKGGTPYLGTKPSRKAVKRLTVAIHEATSRRWDQDRPENRVAVINRLIRGRAAYFDQGPVVQVYRAIQWTTERRLQRWLRRRTGKPGTGYRQCPESYLYQTLGLYRLPAARRYLPNAKA